MVPSFLKKINPDKLFLDVLPAKTRRAFLYCTKMKFFQGQKWYLAGGTALALQVGHRSSVDLDFFTPAPQSKFNEGSVESSLMETGHWITTSRDSGTIYGRLLGAKMSLIAYPFFVPSKQILKCGFVTMLTTDDIAAMKIVAISQRGKKRDFVDLYWYCLNRGPLSEVMHRTMRQYPFTNHNINHFFTSLMYFVDAEDDPMPLLNFEVTWQQVKTYFRTEVPKLARKFLGLDKKS